jgi:1-deoxy-D-xylulose-5-phosphate reductoisomerase
LVIDVPYAHKIAGHVRLDNPMLRKIDWGQIASLTFEPPDTDNFPCLKMAIEAGKQG